MWMVYQKGNMFRVAKENRLSKFPGALTFHMISKEEPKVYWDTLSKEVAFAKAHILNTPIPVLKWELVKE